MNRRAPLAYPISLAIITHQGPNPVKIGSKFRERMGTPLTQTLMWAGPFTMPWVSARGRTARASPWGGEGDRAQWSVWG